MARVKNIVPVLCGVIILGIIAVLVSGWFGGSPEQATPTPTPTPTASPAKLRNITLSFYNPELDKDSAGNIMCSTQGLVRVRRDIPFTNTPIQDAIRLLLAAKPTAQESAQGIISEFPLEGVKLKAASLTGGVLTLTFEDPDNRTGGGSCFVSILSAQVESTAKQFPEVRSVILAPDYLFQP